MYKEFLQIFADVFTIKTLGFLAAAMIFGMLSIKAQKKERRGPYLFLILSFAFLAAHIYNLFTSPDVLPANFLTVEKVFVYWISRALLPVLVVLFIAMAAAQFLQFKFRPGLVRLFFGLTLFFSLYIFSHDWPEIVQNGAILGWGLAWFQVEFREKPQKR
jgi:hypothetical protein